MGASACRPYFLPNALGNKLVKIAGRRGSGDANGLLIFAIGHLSMRLDKINRQTLAIIELKSGDHFGGQPVAPQCGCEFAPALNEVWLRQGVGETLTNHHEGTGAIFLNVAGEEERFADAPRRPI